MTPPRSRPQSGRPSPLAQAVSLQTALVLEASEIRLLTEIGFAASGHGLTQAARRIFTALRQLRPQRAFPVVGLAVSFLNAGETGDAVHLLEAARLDDPDEQALLNAWHGFALQQHGHHHRARAVLQDVAHSAPLSEAGDLATALLRRGADTLPTPHVAPLAAGDAS